MKNNEQFVINSTKDNFNENIPPNVETEIVVVSDTVRQRRVRNNFSQDTSSQPILKNISSKKNELTTSTELSMLPDVLPPETFRLAESSALFSQISQNFNNKSDATTGSESGVELIRKYPLKRKNTELTAQVVEIKVKNIKNDKMSIYLSGLNNGLSDGSGFVQDTVNILEKVEQFHPEFVEMVQILDASEDSDSSLRSENENKTIKNFDQPAERTNSDCKLKTGVKNHTLPILRVERKSISFEKGRKCFDTERDLLKDAEETSQLIEKFNVKPNDHDKSSIKVNKGEVVLYSFDNREFNNDVKTLFFCDDEDISRHSGKTTQPIDMDRNTVGDS